VWSKRGVNGHFDHQFGRPWVTIDETVKDQSARIVGASALEVAILNSLTVNLHLLLCSFYTPTEKRHKILFEAKAFPSDHVFPTPIPSLVIRNVPLPPHTPSLPLVRH